jgi:hypothetical protein
MKERRFVRGDADAEHADVVIFQDKMMVRLVRNRDGDWRLGAGGKCEQEQEQ